MKKNEHKEGGKIRFYWHGEIYEGTIRKVRFGVIHVADATKLNPQ